MGLGRVAPHNLRRGLLHDGPRPEELAAGQRRLVAARAGLADHVDGPLSRAGPRRRCRSATSPTASTSIPGWRPRCGTSTTATSGRSGPSAAASPTSGSGSTSVDDGELWETHQILKSRLISFVRHRAVRQAERRGEPKEVLDRCRRALEPRRADDRLRAAVRHLQAGQPDLPRPRADGAADQRPAVPGPVRLRRQGPSRSTSPASTVLREIAAFARDPQFAGKVVFVEDYDMNVAPAPGAGGRRLAQQPAPAAGGLGHQRPEGRAQRRAEPVGPRRLVGRGLRRHATASPSGWARRTASVEVHDRMDAEALQRTLAEEVVPLYYQRDRDGLPRGWICADEVGDPLARLAVQRRPDGDGLRPEVLRPRRGGHVERHEPVLIVRGPLYVVGFSLPSDAPRRQAEAYPHRITQWTSNHSARIFICSKKCSARWSAGSTGRRRTASRRRSAGWRRGCGPPLGGGGAAAP